MNDADFQTLLGQLAHLTPAQVSQLRHHLSNTQPSLVKPAHLIDLRTGDGIGEFPLKKVVTIICRAKQGDCFNEDYLFINDPAISRSHAMIVFHDDRFWLHDLNSTNGTFVNRFRVQKNIRLKHLDIIQFYKTRFQLYIQPTLPCPREAS